MDPAALCMSASEHTTQGCPSRGKQCHYWGMRTCGLQVASLLYSLVPGDPGDSHHAPANEAFVHLASVPGLVSWPCH